MPYHVYRVTSPSKKVYVGLSKNVKERWRQHKGKAHRSKRNQHPLSDAILCYGDSAFSIETLSSFDDIELAKKEEVRQIAEHDATDRLKGYNISPGGEYDGAFGSKVFWSKMHSDPVAFAAYRENLSAACKKRGGINIDALLAYNRNLSPKERWKRAYRASRISARTKYTRHKGYTLSKSHVSKMRGASRLVWELKPESKKRRHAIQSRKQTTKQWATRTKEEIEELSESISLTLKKRYAEDSLFKDKNTTQIKSARSYIDRSIQGPAASKGLKKFWTEIKKDPERYNAYIATRIATRRANAKNDV